MQLVLIKDAVYLHAVHGLIVYKGLVRKQKTLVFKFQHGDTGQYKYVEPNEFLNPAHKDSEEGHSD